MNLARYITHMGHGSFKRSYTSMCQYIIYKQKYKIAKKRGRFPSQVVGKQVKLIYGKGYATARSCIHLIYKYYIILGHF